MKVRSKEAGFTLLEMLIASTILLIVATGVLSLFTVAVLRNTTAGDHGTRVTEYGQDKMEQLMALSLNDTTSNTTSYPTAPTGGVGLTAGGNLTVASPAANYVDYIDNSGNPSASSTHAAYIRQWTITDDVSGAAALKTITVRVQKMTEINGAIVPFTVLVCQKSNN